jgi:hypothetical protein
MTDDRQRYRHFFRCKACATRFHVDRLTADPAKLKTPACPKKSCKGKVKASYQADVGMDVGAGKAPGIVGANVQTKAYDRAMEITMADHGMSDIQDASRPGAVYRPGESTAPKLPMHLQKQADSFWGSQQQKPATRTAKVNMSGIFGQPQQAPAPVAQFKADSGTALDPILKHRPPGSSPVPEHTVIHG